MIIEFQSNISYQWDLIQCVEDAECRSQYKKKNLVKYKEGISCPYCYNKLTKSQKDRFSMRQKQILIARKFNKTHIYQKEPLILFS